jgi:hypothetical protein
MPSRTRPRAALGACALALALALPACRITPDEIQRIETENELLREQIQSMRLECEQYRKIDIGVDKTAPPRRSPAEPEPAPGEPEPAPAEPPAGERETPVPPAP